MTVQLSTSVRNARLDAIETTIGTSAVLKIRTGAQPANVATADSGTVLATCNLPSDWLAAASSGAKAKSGTWEDASADAAGTAAHFRILRKRRYHSAPPGKRHCNRWRRRHDLGQRGPGVRPAIHRDRIHDHRRQRVT